MKHSRVFTYGRHALSEALRYAPQAVTKVFLDNAQVDTKLRGQIDRLGIPVARLSEGLARSDMRSGAPHQGIIGSISLPRLMVRGEDFFAQGAPSAGSVVVVLGGVQDPHNVGAIIRSAAAFGARAVLLPEKGQAPVTGAVLKVSAGAAFRIPLVSVRSPEQAVLELKKLGYRVYGLAGGSSRPITEEPFARPAALMLGNEGSGIPAEARSLVDEQLAIPTSRRVESLNVAAAAAVALYEWSRRHPNVLG